MPYRTFIDSLGSEWQVWDIVPQLTERRKDSAPERRVATVEVPFDRRAEERRLAEARRALLRGSYSQGWLCFESDGKKRRLSPIPADWTTCSDEELESYLRRGERASSSHAVVVGFSDEPLAEAG